MPTKKRKPIAKKAPARTVNEKLRGIVNLKIPTLRNVTTERGGSRTVVKEKPFYTQKELAAALGISTRTLRRYKNVPGYQLSEVTEKKIRAEVSRVDKSLRASLARGLHFAVEKTKVKGVSRTRVVKKFDKSRAIPPGRILQIPVVYPGQSGFSFTTREVVDGWSTKQKQDLAVEAFRSRRFFSWHFKMRMPAGVGYINGRYVNIAEGDDDDGDSPRISHYETAGPYSMQRAATSATEIRELIFTNENAGRVIVEIYFVENVKPKGKKK